MTEPEPKKSAAASRTVHDVHDVHDVRPADPFADELGVRRAGAPLTGSTPTSSCSAARSGST